MAELISEPPGAESVAAPQQRISPSVMSSLGVGNMGDMGPRYRAALDESGAAMQRVKGAETTREAALQPLEQQIKQAGQTAPTPPTLDKVPDKGYQHIGMSQEEMTKAMQTMFMFAAIGGAMTRQPMTAAMTAFAGGLNGLVKGDQIAFQRGQAEFDSNLKTAIAKNNEAVTEYKMAYEKHKGNLDNLMREWNLVARKHNDTVASALIQSNNAKGMLQHMMDGVKADLQARKLDVQMAETRRYHDAQIGARDADRAARVKIAEDRNAAMMTRANQAAAKLPPKQRDIVTTNNSLLTQVDKAIKLLDGEDVLGPTGEVISGNKNPYGYASKWVPEAELTAYDPQGVASRAYIAALLNQQYKNIAGSAVTVSEATRVDPAYGFRGFDGDAIKERLRVMRSQLTDINNQVMSSVPTQPAAGGVAKPPAGGGAAAPRSFASEAEAEAAGLAPGTKIMINGVSGTWQ